MSKVLEKLFLIRKGEFGKAFLCLSLLFFGAGAVTVLMAARDALLLSLDDISFLPYLYVIVAVCAATASALYARISDKYPRNRIIYAFFLGYAVSFAVFWGISRKAGDWFPWVFYVIANTVILIVPFKLWTFITDLYEPRQGKRLLGFIAIGQISSGIAAGFGIQLFMKAFSTKELLLLASLLFVLAIGMTYVLAVKSKYTFEEKKTRKKEGGQGMFRRILRDPYLLCIAGIFISAAIANVFADYIFKVTAREILEKEALAPFFGFFYGVSGVIMLAYALLLSGRVFSWFGIRGASLLLPVEQGVGAAFALSFPGLFAASVLKFGVASLRRGVNNVAMDLAILPLARSVRGRLKAMLSGVIRPLASGVGGVGLIVIAIFAGSGNLTPYIATLGGLALFWVLLAIPLKRGYLQLLTRSLERGHIRVEDLSVELADDAMVKALEQKLDSADEHHAIYALELLGEIRPRKMAEYCLRLLGHPTPGVVKEVLPRIEALRDRRFVSPLVALLGATPEFTGKILQALAASGGIEARPYIEKYLGEPEVRFDAILSMIRYLGDEDRKRGYRLCRELIEADREEDHLLAARILGEIGTEGMPDVMRKLLEHASSEIRNEIVKAASLTPSEEGLEVVTQALFDPGTKRRATRVIGKFRGAAQRLESMYEPSLDHARRDALVRAAGFVRSTENIPFLMKLLDREEAAIRLDAARSLSRIRKRHDLAPFEEGPVHEAVEGEVREAYVIGIAEWNGFGASVPNAPAILSRAKENRLEAAFRLLGLVYDQEGLHRAFGNFARGGNLSNTVEFLDNVLEWPGKAPLIRFLEEPPEQLEQQFTLLYERPAPAPAEGLLETRDRVLHGLTLWILAKEGSEEGIERMDAGLRSEFDVVRETAAVGLRSAVGAEETRKRIGNLPEGGTMEFERIAKEGAPTLSAIEKVLFLKGTEFFHELGGEYLLHISKVAMESEFSAGETIFKEGDLDRSMFIVVDGAVRIEVHGEEVNVLKNGSCFGEMALLDGKARSASAVASENTHCLKIEYDEFFELITERPEIAKGVMAVLSERLRSMLEQK
ncbi:MAG: cyclic nucleotide-binding domain-containing protein [Planctomycetota bacterium]